MRIPKKKPYSASRINLCYKIENWATCNDSFRKRGRIDFMISSDFSQGWYEAIAEHKNRGRQKKYSDFAIEQCLKIRYLFGLKLRQTQGFIDNLFEICGLSIKCPDYSLTSKRCKKLGLSSVFVEEEQEFGYVSMDSSVVYKRAQAMNGLRISMGKGIAVEFGKSCTL